MKLFSLCLTSALKTAKDKLQVKNTIQWEAPQCFLYLLIQAHGGSGNSQLFVCIKEPPGQGDPNNSKAFVTPSSITHTFRDN